MAKQSQTTENAAPTVSEAAFSMSGPDEKGAVPKLYGLNKRADFLKAARAARAPAPAFLLQARKRAPDEAPGMRVGFTCSKKVGNAVARNRAKRRLRALARLVLPDHGQAGWDYVLIGRAELTAARNFALMQEDLTQALRKVHKARRP